MTKKSVPLKIRQFTVQRNQLHRNHVNCLPITPPIHLHCWMLLDNDVQCRSEKSGLSKRLRKGSLLSLICKFHWDKLGTVYYLLDTLTGYPLDSLCVQTLPPQAVYPTTVLCITNKGVQAASGL